MRKYNLTNFTKGWFIGNFEPSLFKTNNFEIAIKKYKNGDYEDLHMHKISTEWTIIISGKVKMNEIEYSEGDIIQINNGEYSNFCCLSDVTTCVVKIPCVENDKFLK